MGQVPSAQATRVRRTSTASVFGPVVNSKETGCQSCVPCATGCDPANIVSGVAGSETNAASVAVLLSSSVFTKKLRR